MIPKIIHITWKTKDILRSRSPLVEHGLRKLIDLNPDWEVTVHDDQDVEDYLAAKLPPSDHALLAPRGIVEKGDVWRLLKVHEEGGLYADVDRLCDTPLSEIIQPGIRCVLPTYRDFDFSQDIMLSAPGNPIYADTLRLNLERRRAGHQEVYLLGAQTYMHAISTLLTGQMIDSGPGPEVFAMLRERLAGLPFISTYREDPPHDTLLFRGSVTMDHDAEKRKLYAEFGMRHWTGEW